MHALTATKHDDNKRASASSGASPLDPTGGLVSRPPDLPPLECLQYGYLSLLMSVAYTVI